MSSALVVSLLRIAGQMTKQSLLSKLTMWNVLLVCDRRSCGVNPTYFVVLNGLTLRKVTDREVEVRLNASFQTPIGGCLSRH